MSDTETETHSNERARSFVVPDKSGVVPTSAEARAKRRIAALEDELEEMRQERGTKQRFVMFPLLNSCLLLIEPQKDDLLRCPRQGISSHGRSIY
jgi:hypothetical protein